MRDQLLRAASAFARLVLVVVAFGLAVGSLGLSATRGFCPEPDAQALAMPALATIVDEGGDDAPAGDAPAGDAPAGDAPADDAPTDDAPTDDTPAEGGPCPGGGQRCLPPLWSSVLLLGETACHEQAPSQLRGTLVPALVGSTILLAAAWWLRPTRLHGGTQPAASEDEGD